MYKYIWSVEVVVVVLTTWRHLTINQCLRVVVVVITDPPRRNHLDKLMLTAVAAAAAAADAPRSGASTTDINGRASAVNTLPFNYTSAHTCSQWR